MCYSVSKRLHFTRGAEQQSNSLNIDEENDMLLNLSRNGETLNSKITAVVSHGCLIDVGSYRKSQPSFCYVYGVTTSLASPPSWALTADYVKLADVESLLAISSAVNASVYLVYLLPSFDLVHGSPVDGDEVETEGNRFGLLLRSDSLTSTRQNVNAGSKERMHMKKDD